MQQTTDLQINTISETRPAAIPQVKAVSRMAYVDSIRVLLTVLVVMVHAAVTYGSIGSWTYIDPAQNELTSIVLSFFTIQCQSFFMGFFFFFSGYFTPGSFDRKGALPYWKDRLLRLAVPLLIYTWILSLVPNYLDEVANYGLSMSFWRYFQTHLWNSADEGPTWFIFALLAFSAAYTIWRLALRLVRRDAQPAAVRLPVPGTLALFVFALLMAAAMFVTSQKYPLAETFDIFGIFSLMLSFFPQYILLFAAGILAYRNNWLGRLQGLSLRSWTWLSAALFVSLPVFFFLGGATDGHLPEFMSGLNWRCATFNLWIGLSCLSFCMMITLWLRDRRKPQGRLMAFAAPNAFTVYLIHPLILVAISVALRTLAVYPLAKFGLVSVLAVSASFILAGVLRRLPGARAIL